MKWLSRCTAALITILPLHGFPFSNHLNETPLVKPGKPLEKVIEGSGCSYNATKSVEFPLCENDGLNYLQ